MVHRFALAMLVVITCWLQTGCAGRKAAIATADPQIISPLPSIKATEKPQATIANDSDSGVKQTSYISQPEYPLNFSDFPGPINIDTLVQYALDNNPEIQAACYRARSLSARVPQAISLPDPQLATNTFLQEIQTAGGPQQVALSLSQKIPWFGKRSLRGQVSYHEAMSAFAEASVAQLKVVEEVKHAYYDLYFLQSAVAETRRLQPQLEDIVEVAKTKYETHADKTDLADVLQAQVELSELKTTLIRLEETKNQAQARLAGLLHLPPQTHFQAMAHIDRSQLAHTAAILVELSEQCQPQLDVIRQQITRDRSATALATKDYWPDVTVGFNWYDIGNGGISPVANGEDAYSLGVGLNLPIYRNRLNAAVREAHCNSASDHRRYAATLDLTQSGVESLYAQFQQQHRILAVLETEILPRSEQMLALMIESYRTGRQDFQQMIDAYQTLLNYRIDFHKRTAMREQAVASLERTVGCAVTANTIESPGPFRTVARPAENTNSKMIEFLRIPTQDLHYKRPPFAPG